MKNFKTNTKKWFSTILLLVVLVSIFPAGSVSAATSSSTVTIKVFNTMLKKITKKDVLKQSDFKDTSKAITNQQAAYLLQRADVMLNGDGYNFDLYQNVVNYKRIKDISKADKKYRTSLRMCFVKGLLPGFSDGEYSQTRSLKPTTKVTKTQASSMMTRLQYKAKRFKLTWDGQLTRTKNLPKNHKSFPYILASFPNEYYEAKFDYERYHGFKDMTPGVHYFRPVDMEKYMYEDEVEFPFMRSRNWAYWKDIVYTNLHCRFNYNYDCSNAEFTKWSQTLANTYFDSGLTYYHNKNITNNKYYRQWANLCKTHIKSSKIVMDSSSIYRSWGGDYYIRAYVKFKVDAGTCPTAKSTDQNGLIQGDIVYLPEIKNKKWCTTIVDIPLGGYRSGMEPGADWKVTMSILASGLFD